MDTLMIELWTNRKEAELPLSELDAMTKDQLEKFWWIQEEELKRTVLLRYVEEI